MIASFWLSQKSNFAIFHWLSDGTNNLNNPLNSPYPKTVKHHIKVFWDRGYPADLRITGYVASGHPEISYVGTKSPDQWVKVEPSVVKDTEVICTMDVSQTPAPARVQCARVEYSNVWTLWLWRSALSSPVEFQVMTR